MGNKTPKIRKIPIPLAVLLLAVFLRLYRLAAVPFGWHPDEATKALLARDVLAGKYFPVFFSAFTGREALFVYLEAMLFALVGEGIFAGRLLAAFVGILTVALTYITGREWFNRRTGLLAAAFLAVSLWHLIASRNGYRAVIQPLIQLPVLLLLFRGLRSTGGSSWHGISQAVFCRSRHFSWFDAVYLYGRALVSPSYCRYCCAGLALRPAAYDRQSRQPGADGFGGLSGLLATWLLLLAKSTRFFRASGTDLRFFARMGWWKCRRAAMAERQGNGAHVDRVGRYKLPL